MVVLEILIRAVVAGRLEGRWCWSICPKQPLSRCCCRPLVRVAQLLLESPTVQKKGPTLLPSILHPSVSPALHLSAQTPLQEDETNQQPQPLCSQPVRLQFQTSLDHFSCSPEMNNAHINWCQLINFRLTALYFSIRVWLLRFVLQNSLIGLPLQIIPVLPQPTHPPTNSYTARETFLA